MSWLNYKHGESKTRIVRSHSHNRAQKMRDPTKIVKQICANMRPIYSTISIRPQNSEIGHVNWNRVYTKNCIIFLFCLRWGPYKKKIEKKSECEKTKTIIIK